MSNENQEFIKIVDLLTQHKINFWISNGTLLGIIRDNQLIPWDHDIDISVFEYNSDRNYIRSIFISSGYIEEIIDSDFNSLHFKGVYRKLDINFYIVKDNIATTRWLVPDKNKYVRLKRFLASSWLNKNKDEFNDISINSIFNLIKIIWLNLLILKKIIPNFLLDRINTFMLEVKNNNSHYGGYSYNTNLLKTHNITYQGCEIPVPIQSIKVLELTYGRNWKIPKQDFIWYEEAKNIKIT